jgi:phosphotransacetylase
VDECKPLMDGEMHAETALNEKVRNTIYPGSTLTVGRCRLTPC